MSIDVVLFVEHVDRELDSAVRVAQELAARRTGAAVLSVNFHSHLLVTRRWRPRVVLFPYIMGSDDWPVALVRDLYGPRIHYVNMNWEQLLSPVNRDYKAPREPFQQREVLQLAWDESFAAYLERHEVSRDRIRVVGNLAEELLAARLRERPRLRARLAAELGADPEVPWLFFPLNYGWAFLSDRLVEKRIEQGFDPERAWEYREFSIRNRDAYVRWVTTAARALPDRVFVVRPHPNVSTEEYQVVFQALVGGVPSNVHLSKAHSVREWLPASDAVLSSWSTVVWDAARVGIPGILIAPFPRPKWLNVDWNDRVENLTDEASFVERLRAVRVRDAEVSGSARGAVERYAEVVTSLLNGSGSSVRGRRTPGRYALLKSVQSALRGALFSMPWLGRRLNAGLAVDYFRPRIFPPDSTS